MWERIVNFSHDATTAGLRSLAKEQKTQEMESQETSPNRLRKLWKRKRVKGTVIMVLVYLALTQVASSCLQFRMSRQEVMEDFAEEQQQPEIYDIVVEGQAIRYATIGDPEKPMVFFVHGSPGSWTAYIDFMKDSLLLQKAFLVSVDRPGFGHSNFGHGEPELEAQSAVLLAVMEHIAPQARPILVGHSMGGPVIARMAIDSPEAMSALVFVAASVDPVLEPATWYRHVMKWPVVRNVIPRSFRASNTELLPLKGELEEMLPYWEQITVPATVIQGTEDSLVPAGNADFLEEKLQGVPLRVRMLEGVNHFIPWSHPEEIREAIFYHLEERED